jgi:hypothetical protein
VKRELERITIPREHDARARTWSVVARAFHERQPTRPRAQWPRVAAVAIALAALGAAALSSPGRAVLDEVREVVGVERAQPALFSLPAEGRLLVASDAGVWVAQEDGSKRLLGPYREASWSPFGRFVVVARENELAALEPDGDVRWSLARPGVRSPRWAGTETDTRIAYLDRSGVRVVAGDGTDDRLVAAGARGPLVWLRAPGFELGYVDARGRLVVTDVVSGRTKVRPGRADPLRARIVREGAESRVLAGGRVVFRASGRLVQPVWSPDGRWLVVGWPTADQWVFVSADGKRIRAVSNVSEQFRSRSFPRVEGWCCARE